jgi:sigma-E factor negative regulatory protein RseC
MKEEGIVVKLADRGMAKVQFRAGSACAKCGACVMAGNNVALIEAKNDAGAKEGDLVEVSIEPSKVIWASFMVFILPLVALIIGYFVGSSLVAGAGFAQNFGIVFAVLFLSISFLGLGVYDRLLRRGEQFNSKISRIVRSKER